MGTAVLDTLVCEVCGKGPFKARVGLVGHARSHKAETVIPSSLPQAAGPVHPLLVPPKEGRRLSAKQKRTTVRTVKLVNVANPAPMVVQVSISRGTNNGGEENPALQAQAALRYNLNLGLLWPHEWDPSGGTIGPLLGDVFQPARWPYIMCAIKDCWDPVAQGSERCPEHEQMWETRMIRYAV